METKSILQVITLLGTGGSYGGPLRVAFENAEELNRQGHLTKIIGGVFNSAEFPTSTNVETLGIKVLSILKSYKISSLYGIRVPGRLLKEIKQFDIVHIHFARDLIPITAALICIILRKPFYLQTHGMVKRDNRYTVRLVDRIFTKKIFQIANTVFALQSEEFAELRALGFQANYEILPNGIHVNSGIEISEKTGVFIAVFCARLAPVKQVDRFLDIAKRAAKDKLNAKFEIYGPDGGELSRVLEFIEKYDLHETLTYKGVIKPLDVPTVLSKKSLLVLPSRYDPFPVSILEALAVGTPVLVNNSCGISDILKTYDHKFVSIEDNASGLYTSFMEFYKNPVNSILRSEIQQFTQLNFSIEKVVEDLVQFYNSGRIKRL